VEDVVALTAELTDPLDREKAIRGAVRSLREHDAFEAGRLRAVSGEAFGRSGGPVARGLRRLADRESPALKALLTRSEGRAALLRGAFEAAAGGDPIAVELARLAAAGPWTEEEGRGLASVLPTGDAVGARTVAEIGLGLVREGADPQGWKSLILPLVEGSHASVVTHLAPPLADRADPGLAPGDGSGPTPSAAETLEPLRRAALRRASSSGLRELDDAVVALVELGRRSAPPSTDPGPWEELLDGGSGAWLSRGPILENLARAFGAGEERYGTPSPCSGLGTRLARRVLGRVNAAGLDDVQATAILRLLWLEGDGATLDWLVETRPEDAPALLARLLVVPAPMPLFPGIRAALVRALQRDVTPRGLQRFSDELEAWAPALRERVGVSGEGDR
jgi:hypothetical protein